jgi:hypothetical protein
MGFAGEPVPLADLERSRSQQEIPSLPIRRRVRQCLEIAVIAEVHAEIQEHEIMNSAGWA